MKASIPAKYAKTDCPIDDIVDFCEARFKAATEAAKKGLGKELLAGRHRALPAPGPQAEVRRPGEGEEGRLEARRRQELRLTLTTEVAGLDSSHLFGFLVAS
jgi:hypothetical protein